MGTKVLNDSQVAGLDMSGAQTVDLSTDQLLTAMIDYVNKHGLVKAGVYRGVLFQSEFDSSSPTQVIKRVRLVYMPK